MYRERIAETPAKSPEAMHLKALMLAYHDYQQSNSSQQDNPIKHHLAEWQTERLKVTHADLYDNLNFRGGIDFLLEELYGAHDFSARDRDLERIFPKLLKLLPKNLINTVANLVELNLLTQQLDDQLAQYLMSINASDITEILYVEAYQKASTAQQRQRQLDLVKAAGELLDKHAHNPLLRLTLNWTKKPAKKAGLEELHGFLLRGLDAFYEMRDVDVLMQTLIERESHILSNILNNRPNPFQS